ncbi:helix-turn-helix domain-containing protein [Roseovarius sp. S1116L3]|uniref:helix-turn-helix domain-containing protein n=1 Tax=Roseovarius roseus TaxID=3342636 RepID=UPI003727CD79
MPHCTKYPAQGHSRVKSVIAGLVLTGTVSVEAVASHFGISPRTLQRRLNQRGIGFWTMVEQSRFEIAGALLHQTDLQVQEIAAKLGYSTPGGFSRAFTRWAGCSPSAFRAKPEGKSRNQTIGAKWAELEAGDQ